MTANKNMTKKTANKKGKWDAQKGVITSIEALRAAEEMTRKFPNTEYMPFARGVSWTELPNIIKDEDGDWVNPIFVTTSRHVTTIGVD